jgi:hypothetical protein
MEPSLAIAGAGAAIAGISQIVGMYMQRGEADKARQAIQDAVDQYGPEAYTAISNNLGGPSALEGLRAEQLAPEAVAAQKNALARLQQVTEKGYTAEEQAALNRIQQQSAAQAAQQQAALKSQMARRGVAGTGQELAMNLANLGQQSANQYQAGLDVAANAQRRAFQAMQAQGQLGGQVRQEAYGEAERRAAANEERARLRGQAGMNIAGQKAAMQTGAAQSGYQYGTMPGQQVAGIGTAFGTPLVAYGTMMAKKKDGE